MITGTTKIWRIIFGIGVAAIILAAIDPLEGCVIILAGNILVSLASWLLNDRHRKLFLLTNIFIALGVASMFAVSYYGGFGPESSLSRWWAATFIPYPLGWLIIIGLLVYRLFKKQKHNLNQSYSN